MCSMKGGGINVGIICHKLSNSRHLSHLTAGTPAVSALFILPLNGEDFREFREKPPENWLNGQVSGGF